MRFSLCFVRTFWHWLWVMAPVWGIVGATVTGLGLWVARVEGLPWSRGLYFAWITATTVGYGDISPQTTLGRLLCVAIALIGIVFTGIVVSIAVSAAREAMLEMKNVDEIRAGLRERLNRNAPETAEGNGQ